MGLACGGDNPPCPKRPDGTPGNGRPNEAVDDSKSGTAVTDSSGNTSNGDGGGFTGWLKGAVDTAVNYGSAIFSQPEVWWGAAETAGSLFLMGLGGDITVAGVAVCLTGVGCLAGAPAVVGGVSLIGFGAYGTADGIGRINNGLKKAFSEARSESSGSSGGSRTFTSDDPLVGDLANSIEAKYPGLVDDVNVPVSRADGSTLTDFDIELKNAVIQVKAGPGKGAGAQVTRTQEGTDKPVIVYGPKLRPAVVKEVNSRGGIGVTSVDDLLSVIAP